MISRSDSHLPVHIEICSAVLGGDKVSMLEPILILTNPGGRLKWLSAVTELTVYFTCGLISALILQAKKMVWSNVTQNILIEYNETRYC